MHTPHEEITEVLRTYVTAGLVEHDADKFLACVSDDIIGFGMGEQGFVSSKQQMREILAEGLKDGSRARYALSFEDVVIRVRGGDAASLCARIVIRRTCEGETKVSGLQQSLTLKREHGKWLICAIHASPVLLSSESIDAYPLRFADNTLAHLRQEMQTEAFDLLNKSISGGILSCRVEEGGFPLYFVNDSMLSYLDFSRQEFVRICEDSVLELVHPDDKPLIRSTIEKALATGKDYEVRYRVLRKGGDFIWVLCRGRRTVDENGAAVLINILIDITEMVRLQSELSGQAEALKEQAGALAVSEERFRIALEKTSNIIFDYDIASGNIIHSSAPKKPVDFVTNIRDAAETLVIGGEIVEASLPGFWDAFEGIRRGAPQTECVVRVRLAGGREIWNRISMTGIADADGRAVRAIGMIEDITTQKEAEIAFAREEQYRRLILAHSPASYIINFSAGVFESCRINSPVCRYTYPGEPYDEVLYNTSKARLGEEERRAFLDTFSRVNVMNAFERGQTELELEYELFNPDGSTTWMRSTLRSMPDVATSELKGFLYVTDINKMKRAELELRRQSERDPLTGLYNKGAAEARIREKLRTSEELQTGVFMILDVDQFKSINDTYGHPFGDTVLSGTARALCDTFRESDIVGRLGGDEFCVFFSGMRSRKRVEQAARTICREIRGLFVPGQGQPGVSCSIGIALCNGLAKPFEQIYGEADRALYGVKASGRDGYAFFDDSRTG